MKRLILIALIALGMSASAQTTTRVFFIDTIVSSNGISYTNTFDEIYQYHESDALIYETDSDANGNWVTIYYDDTAKEPTVYIYYMAEELCYKMVTVSGHREVRLGPVSIKL